MYCMYVLRSACLGAIARLSASPNFGASDAVPPRRAIENFSRPAAPRSRALHRQRLHT